MKGSLAYLKAAVVGFAVVAGGKALYDNREKLKRGMRSLKGFEGLKDFKSDLSLTKVLDSARSLRELAAQFSHIK